MKKKKIILTGGGSAGHVTPNMALLPYLENLGYEVAYIGSKNGIEKEIVQNAGVKYYAISSGKLRRYFHKKNFSDPFRVIKGIGDAMGVLIKEKPQVVFSKGGFVVVPVVIAAKILGIPTVAHESDMTPGLANKIATPFVKKICVTFPEAKKWFKDGKVEVTGTPIRGEIFKGDSEKGRMFLNADEKKKTLMIMGGSLGAQSINKEIRVIIKELVRDFNVVHLCGKNNVDESLVDLKGYNQFEYVSRELSDIMALSDVIISRAGANSIFEFLALNKPNILIPLSSRQSRGDQILNAKSFEKNGYSIVLDDDTFKGEDILKALERLREKESYFINNMKKSGIKDGTENVLKVIASNSK